MFEDKTYEALMEEALSQFSSEYRTDEASLIYNAISKICLKIEELYSDMSTLGDNILLETMDLSTLINYGSQFGVEYKEATYSQIRATFSSVEDIDVGDKFISTINQIVFEVISKDTENLTCNLVSLTEGIVGNISSGTITSIDVSDITGTISALVVTARDDEDEEVYRERIIQALMYKSFAGNKAAFRNSLNALSYVGASKTKRRQIGSQYVDIYFVNASMSAPTQQEISDLQNLVDPLISQGEGDGYAPISMSCQVHGATAQTCNIALGITVSTGYDIEALKPIIQNEISKYFTELKGRWENQETNSITVVLEKIKAAVIDIEGVADINSCTINGTAANVVVTYDKIPELGTITYV